MSGSGNESRTFESLDVWNEARAFRNRLSDLVEEFPERETYNLGDQLLRSSRSITSNIAEGYGRFHYQENLQFCRQARGSLFEVLDQLTIAYDEEYIHEDTYSDLRSDVFDILKLLNGYMAYIKDEQNKGNES